MEPDQSRTNGQLLTSQNQGEHKYINPLLLRNSGNRTEMRMTSPHFQTGTPHQKMSQPRIMTNCAATDNAKDFINTPKTENEAATSSPVYHSVANAIQNEATLMCAEVTLYNPHNPSTMTPAIAFFNSGANKSYITETLAEKLKLQSIGKETMHIYTFGARNPLTSEASSHVIGIVTNTGNKLLNVKALTTLTHTVKYIKTATPLQQNLKLTLSTATPQILIGNDYFWDLILSDDFYYKQLPDGHRMIHTSIGNIITEHPLTFPETFSYTCSSNESAATNPANHDELTELVARFWEMESAGIKDNPEQNDDDECLKFFRNTVYYDEAEKRYMVKLPFKVNPKCVPDNYSMAYARLRNSVTSMSRNESYMEKYNAIFIEQLEKGIIEHVPDEELAEPSHYLSHHGVIKKDGDQIKVRCVYDGSAKTKGHISINEALFRGPVLLPDLAGILLRSRFPKILISSDIGKASLMVGLQRESRNYTRFLWLKDHTKPLDPDNIVTYRFQRVPFGLICSPFLLSGTIHHHLETMATPLSQCLLRNTYVDNIFHGVTNFKEGTTFYKESKSLFNKAGMNLRAYASNSEELNNFFDEKELTKTARIQKLLGLYWNADKDQLVIRLPTTPPPNITWTKRKILKEVASIYDPLGWTSPTTLISKTFLQSLWKMELCWDDALPEEQDKEWKSITTTWTTSEFTLPRLIMMTSPHSIFDIHVFTDASNTAYCAVAYLVQHKEQGEHDVALIMAKSKLAPLRHNITIPRLEISALSIGAKLLAFLMDQLTISVRNHYLWSDSKIAIIWTKNNKDLPVFVRNRVKAIEQSAPNAILKHIPGHLNPADIGTRGTTIDQLIEESTWWNGPHFLRQDEDQWPDDITEETSAQQEIPDDNTDSNLQANLSHDQRQLQAGKTSPTPEHEWQARTSVHATTEEELLQTPQQPSLIDSTRFSSWTLLLNTIVYVLRFLTTISSKAASYLGGTPAALHSKAEVILFRQAQRQSPPSTQLIAQLRLFQCQDTLLWKSQGRIDNANLPSQATTPILLPHDNYITHLYVLYVHTSHNHCGESHTLTAIRQCAWIPKGRAVVKKVIKKYCFHCKRYSAKPFTLPPFPIHPPRRLTPPKYPFQNTGMDFFGPLSYRKMDNTAGKYWMILFTCLNTRAIVVEVLLDMSARTVLHVLRRFIATIGCPTWLICDNAQSFKTIANCYNSTSTRHNDEDILDYCTKQRIQMKFIPAMSPWQGGIYEKMIDLFKKSFKHAVGTKLLDLDDITTTVKESEAIVNTRPLTYVTNEVDS